MRIGHITNTSYIIILLRCQLSFLHRWSSQSGTFCERKKQRASHCWASPIAQLLFTRRKGWVNSNEKIFPPGKMWSVRLRTWWEQGLETWGLCVGSVSTHWTLTSRESSMSQFTPSKKMVLMSQVAVRMREVIRTFKALIRKRFCKPLNSNNKPLNSNNNDVFPLICLLIEILCLRLFVTQHSIAG